jgi:glycosyltransferase involved in cell wall biosynthesis
LTSDVSIVDLPFTKFVASYFDADEYLADNPDVSAARIDPLVHWMQYGAFEGRSATSRLEVRRQPPREYPGGRWTHFNWCGEDFYVRPKDMPSAILKQILKQGRLDPAISAAGPLALKNLRYVVATDLADRDGVHVDRVFASLPSRPDALLIIPFLVVGGAEKFSANLTAALRATGMQTVAVLITDQESKNAPDLNSLAILKGFQGAQLIFWKDICGHAYDSDVVLSRVLNAIRPQRIIVINSRVGLETIARFGRGLSQFSKLYCAYFSLGFEGLGATFGVYFPRRTWQFAVTLTDNEATAAILRDRYGDLPGPGIVVLPPETQPIDESTFQKRLLTQRARVRELAKRWLWISRIEPLKGTHILAGLAKARPNDRFELFGPVEQSLESLGLDLPNIVHHGVLEDVPAAYLNSYDGFLFTSLFEGMPNVVLEMAQHAIPMVLAKVGGIPETFDDRAVCLVDMGDEESASISFCKALDRLATLSADEIEAIGLQTRRQALARHSPATFRQNVSKLFGQGMNEQS